MAINGFDLSDFASPLADLLSASPRSKKEAAGKLSELLAGLEPENIPQLDESVRGWLSWNWNKDRHYTTSFMTQPENRAALIFASFDPDGHIRQAAVEQLAEHENVLPYITLRMTDWVAEVRSIASDAFAKAVRNASDEEITASMPVFFRLSGKQRGNFGCAIDMLRAEAAQRPELVRASLASDNRNARRFVLRYLLSDKDASAVADAYRSEKDPFLRSCCCDYLLRHADADILELLLRDKSPRVAAMALNYLYEHEPAAALDAAKPLLCGRSAGIRSLAQFIVGKLEPTLSIRQYYLEYIHRLEGCELAGCISGLGEYGEQQDHTVLAPFLEHERPSVIRAAMSALTRIDEERYCPVITELLASPLSSVSKTACALLQKSRSCSYDRIQEIYASSSSDTVRLRCAAVLLSSSKWQSLIYALSMLDDPCDDIGRMCVREINRRLNDHRNFMTPAREQAERIKQLLSDNSTLPKQLKRKLAFMTGL